MAKPDKTGLAYALETMIDFKYIFEQLLVEMNNDVKDELKISKLITRGIGQCNLSIDDLQYVRHKMTFVIEKGQITKIENIPPDLQIRIMNFDTGKSSFIDHNTFGKKST